MSVQENGTGGVVASAPIKTWEFIPGVGEAITESWPAGEPTAMDAKYAALKVSAQNGTSISGVRMESREGKRLIEVRYNTDATGITVDGTGDIQIIEELYAFDLIRDISAAPYFARTVDGDKGLPLSSDSVSKVRLACELGYSTDDITANFASGYQWASWSTGMKELRWHYNHGQDSYFETAFILRRSSYGVRKSRVQASFTGINTVVTAPTMSSSMEDLIAALPSGEWLYKPPQSENLGKGRWRIAQEWHWAEKWSIVYGGTANGTT